MEEPIKIVYNSDTSNFEITTFDLVVKQGNTKTFVLNFVDENDAAYDITNYIIFFTIKSDLADADADADLTKDISIHSSPAAGESKIELLATDSKPTESGLSDLLGNYMYSIKLKTDDSPAKLYTVAEGLISFTKDVTQRNSWIEQKDES